MRGDIVEIGKGANSHSAFVCASQLGDCIQGRIIGDGVAWAGGLASGDPSDGDDCRRALRK